MCIRERLSMVLLVILNHSLRFYNFLCRVSLRGGANLLDLLQLQFLQILCPVILFADRYDLIWLQLGLPVARCSLNLVL